MARISDVGTTLCPRNVPEASGGTPSAEFRIGVRCVYRHSHGRSGYRLRYFMVRASDAIAAALRQTQRGPEIVAVLDGLLAGHPDMHLLVDYDPELIRRCVDLRASNIALGLSSVVVVTQPKSASIPIANIFCSGFNLPSFAYSLANVEVIQSWARDYARGGACYVTHLEPSAQNIDRLKQASIEKVIVHVRDPRQSLLSMIHHLTRYPNNLPALSRNAFDGRSISDQVSELMDFYIRRIRWIQGWMDAESRLSAMFSTFESSFVIARLSSTAISTSMAPLVSTSFRECNSHPGRNRSTFSRRPYR